VKNGAGDGIRTRDPELGKLVLYQLSYTRNVGRLIGVGRTVQATSREPPPPPRAGPRHLPLVFVCAVLAAVLGIRTPTAGRVLARLVEQGATQALGEDVKLGRLEVGVFPPEVTVHDLRVSHPVTREQIARVARARLEPSMGPWGAPRLGRVDVLGADILLHVDADGLREFRAVAPGDDDGPLLPWDSIRVADSRVGIVAGARRLDLHDVAVEQRAPGTVDVSVGTVILELGGRAQRARDLRLTDVVLQRERLAVRGLDLAFPDLWVRADVEARLDTDALTGTVAVSGDLGPLLGAPRVVGQVEARATLAGAPRSPVLEGDAAARGLAFGATRVGDLTTRWRLTAPPDAASRLDLGPAQVAWGRGTLALRGEVDLDTTRVTAHVEGEGVHLADVLRDLDVHADAWVDFAGDLALDLEGTLQPLALSGPFALTARDVRVTDGPAAPLAAPSGRGVRRGSPVLLVDRVDLAGRVAFDTTRLEFDVGRLDARTGARRSRGSARATVRLDGDHRVRVDADLDRVDLRQLAPLGDVELAGVAEIRGWFDGAPDRGFGAAADIAVADLSLFGFPLADEARGRLDAPDLTRLDFTGIQARLGETGWSGRYVLDLAPDDAWMQIEARVDAGRVRDLVAIVEPVDGIDGRVVLEGHVEGTSDTLTGEVHASFADVDLFGERFPEGRAVSWFEDGRFTLEELRLAREGHRGGRETVLARGSIGPAWGFNLDALWDGADLARMDVVRAADIPLAGRAVLSARVRGDVDHLAPEGTVALRDVRWDGQPLGDGVLHARTEGEHLRVEGALGPSPAAEGDAPLRVDARVHLAEGAAWEAELAARAFPLHVAWPRAVDGAPVTARLDGGLRAQGGTSVPTAFEGRLDGLDVRWRSHALRLVAPASIRGDGTSTRLSRVRLVGDDGTDVAFGGDSVDGFEGSGAVDLDLARAFVPGLLEASGRAALRLELPRGAVGWAPRAALDLAGARVLTDYFPAALEDLSASVRATPEGYTLSAVKARAGGGTFTSAESRIDAVDWVPVRYAMEGALDDVTVAYFDDLPPITGDAALQFAGPADDPVLSGTIDVARMEFRDRVDWESMVLSLREERLTILAPEETGRYFAMDLDVRADDTVLLRNNVAEGTASGRLRVLGDTSRPGMTGTVALAPGGRVFLHERTFDVQRAELRWVDPYAFDPELDIRLETVVRRPEQDYRVTYMVTGPFSDWRTDTSADPYLSQADVNALLLFGTTRAELDRVGGLGAALVAETSDLLLAQTALGRLDAVVDRWSLVSGVNERGSGSVSSELRLVADKQVGQLGLTLETALGAGLGSDWYVSAERRIAERLYVRGYAATRQEGRALPIGAAYGAEFKLRWELDLE
jgi:hypothetical protein